MFLTSLMKPCKAVGYHVFFLSFQHVFGWVSLRPSKTKTTGFFFSTSLFSSYRYYHLMCCKLGLKNWGVERHSGAKDDSSHLLCLSSFLFHLCFIESFSSSQFFIFWVVQLLLLSYTCSLKLCKS